MTDSLLSAALIVKNEEEKLPGCLESLVKLMPLLGEICVYDTGSTDATIDIAKSFGVRLQKGFWDSDFARAKNAATAMTSGQWVLNVDADERVQANLRHLERHLRVISGLPPERVQAVQVALLDYREGQEKQAHLVPRLYRRGCTKWVGRIHEQVETIKGVPLQASDPGRDVISLIHTGYDAGEKLQQKRLRNAEIARIAIQEAREAGEADSVQLVRGLVDHARSVLDLGEWDRAYADLLEVRKLHANPVYRTFGLEILADMLTDAERFTESADVIFELKRSPLGNKDYHRWLGVRLMLARREFRAALDELRGLDVLVNAVGVVAQPVLLLTARFKAALACGEHLEAAACLVALMGKHGVMEEGGAELLLKLTYDLGPQDVAGLLYETGPRYRAELLQELRKAGPRGSAVAAHIQRMSHTGAAFGSPVAR